MERTGSASRVELPSLHAKIRGSFLLLVGVYALLGTALVLAVFAAGRNTPRVIHRNYDSIAALARMQDAWNALRLPGEYSGRAQEDWKAQFDEGLRFEESNVTEPGEADLVRSIRSLWQEARPAPARLGDAKSARMRESFQAAIRLNEEGMFRLAEENSRLSRGVLTGSILFFVVSLLFALGFAQSLARRLSRPLTQMALVLQGKPSLGRRLPLAEPTTAEMRVLDRELQLLWERVGEIEALNVNELIREKSKLETVLESVEDLLLVIDPKGRIVHCSKSVSSLLGLPSSELVGKDWHALPLESAVYARLKGLFAGPLPDGLETELEVAAKKRVYAIRQREIHGSSPEISVATLYFLKDITETRQRHQLRKEMIDLLSHELKTPLQSLGTASELLHSQRTDFAPNQQLLVDTIAEDVERLRAVANEFVAIQATQTQAKFLKVNFQRLPLQPAIEAWTKPFQVLARDKEVRVEIAHEGSSEILARIDEVKFPWVITNLLSNAIRYSPRGGTVVVLLTDRNGGVEIQVRDQGPGVAPEDRERIFDPFFQSLRGGTFGIGLTIAKEVVEAHDGRLEYHPNRGGGSTFRIVLPFPDSSGQENA